MRRLPLIWLLLLAISGPVAFATEIPGDGAHLQGLDKVTARIQAIEAPVDGLVQFGALEIIIRACRYTPPEEKPESAAFLEIRELRKDEAAIDLFKGWMFASSPALSALEHPVYDIWVTGCRRASHAVPAKSR